MVRGLHNLCAVLDLKDTTESSVSAELLSEEVGRFGGLQPVDLCNRFARVVGPGKLTEKWMQIPTIDQDVIVHVTMNPKFHYKKAVSKCVQQVRSNVSFLEVSCNQIEFVASSISCVQVYPEQLQKVPMF